jgi:hypothetical protein
MSRHESGETLIRFARGIACQSGLWGPWQVAAYLSVSVIGGHPVNGGEIRRKSFGANALRLRPQCQIQTYMMPMPQFPWGIRVKASSVASELWGDLLATA